MKIVHSELPGGEASGFALDLGLRSQYCFDISDYFYITPGLGVSLQNMGPDSIYYTDEQSGTPFPKTLRTGVSIETGVPDALWVAALFDITKQLYKDHYEEPIYSRGLQVGITPLIQLNCGVLLDNYGSRHEFHKGFTAGYRHEQFLRFLKLMGVRTDLPEPERNFHILYSFSDIETRDDNHVRDNQRAHQFSLGFSFGNKNERVDVPEDELELSE